MKQLLAMLLALVMVLSMIPMTAIPAFAEEHLILDEPVAEEPAAPVEEEPAEEPAEEPVEEPAEEPAEEPVEEPAEEPATKNAAPVGEGWGCGYNGDHYSVVVNNVYASANENGEVIICFDNFPDENFRNYIAENVDTDGNGLLNETELLISEIHCQSMGIADLQGVGLFGELKSLHCQYNALSNLDISANTQLWYLDCSENQIGSLDISNNTALTHLWVNENPIGNLDISHNTALTNVGLGGIGMKELDISQHDDLVVLQIWGNGLTELDLSGKTKLEHLNISGNNFASLDVSGCTALEQLYCTGNKLTSLDVSGCANLKSMDCSYQYDPISLNVSGCTALVDLSCADCGLTSLDVSTNTGLQHLYCQDNNLAQLNLSANSRLEWLNCSNNHLTGLDLSANSNLFNLECSNNHLLALNLPVEADISYVGCGNQNWNGELDYTVNENGWYNVDLSAITNPANVINIVPMTGSCERESGSNIVSFEEDPHNGFCYEYLTGWDGFTLSCSINVFQGGGSGGDEEPEYIILEIPAIEDMTQLFLEEEAVVQWTEEDHNNDSYKWFYFTAEEDMEITFVTTADMNYEEHLDPMAYWTDAEGRVIVHSDDNDTLNSAIYVFCNAGETYYFAVKNLNAQTGPLPVVILEGDHTGGGGGGEGWGEPDFSEIAPALEDMTVLELDVESTATIENPGEYDWFAFTPATSGTYSFFSGREPYANLDPYGYLLNADLELLQSNDDSAGNLNFSMTCQLEAGQTYVLAAKVLGDNIGSYPVKVVAAKEIVDISVAPISLPEGSCCQYNFALTDQGMETKPYYYWQDLMQVTLTFSDGTTATGTGRNITHEGITYHLNTFDHQSYGIVSWKAGNTYEVEVYIGDHEVSTQTTVKITSSQIKSISVEDLTIREYAYGSFENAYDEEGEYLGEYFHYGWVEGLKWTVTFTDGKKTSVSGPYFTDKNGYPYWLTTQDDQWYTRPWVAGGTYTGTVYLAGIEKQVDVTIRGTTESLAPVENLKRTDVGETWVKIKFDAVEGAERYEIYVNGAYWANTTSTSYKITGLSLGSYYDIAVAAAEKVDGIWRCGPIGEPIWAHLYRDISDYYLKLEYTSTVYDGTAKMPGVTLKKTSSSKAMSSDTYVTGYGFNVDVGQAWVEVDGIGEYGGYILKDFKILPQQVTGVEVVDITSNSATITFDSVVGATEYWIYNGSKRVAKTEGTSYTITGLSAGTTYKFSVKANAVVVEHELDENIGEFVPVGTEDYTGKASATVSAKPVYSMEDCEVTVKDPVKAYTGKKITNSFTVKNPDGKTLKKDTDYTVSYENNVEMGMAMATLKGKGKYAGQTVAFYCIGPKAVTDVEVDVIDGTSVEVSFDTQKGATYYYIYVDGTPVDLTYDDEYVITGLTAGKKHSITVAAVISNEQVNIVGVQSKAVTATPKHNLLDYITGAYVHFDDGEFWTCNYTGKKVTPAVDVWVNHGNGEEMLVPGEDFVVEFKNNKNVGEATFTIKGTGAYYGSMRKQEFYIIPATVTNLRVKDSTETSVTLGWTKGKGAAYYEVFVDGYNVGKTTGSSFKIKNLVEGEEHEFSVVACKKVSKQGVYASDWVTISGRAGKHIGDCKVSLEYTSIAYTGEPNEPAVTVKTSSKSSATTLVEGVDYTVTYVAVVGPGEAGVIIEGIGEYTGTVSKTFDIVPGQVGYLFAQAVTNTRMEVVWDEVPGATEYWVYVNGSRKAKVSDTVCTISGLKKGKTYKVTVKAVAEVNGEDFVGAASAVEQCYMGVKA